MSRLLPYLAALTAVFLLGCLAMHSCESKKAEKDAAKYRRRFTQQEQRHQRQLALAKMPIDLPDTVWVEKIGYGPAAATPEKPVLTLVGTTADTARRNVAERGNIVIGLERRKNLFRITQIDPKGIPIQNFYDPKLLIGNWSVDSLGRLQVDRKSIRRLKRNNTLRKFKNIAIGIPIGAVALFFLKP